MKMKPYILLLLIALICASNTYAQQVVAKVDKNKLAVGQQLTYKISVQNLKGGQVMRPKFNGFKIIGQNSFEVNFNGQLNSEYIFELVATKVGKITIGPSKVQVGNKAYESQSITVEVVEGNNQSQSNTFGIQPGNQNNNTPPKKNQQQRVAVSDLVFIKLLLDKGDPYVGEQMTATWKIYKRADLQYKVKLGGQRINPVFNGFWSKEIEIEESEDVVEELDGIKYKTRIIKKVALFPQKSGELTIPELTEPIIFTQQQRQLDLWNARYVIVDVPVHKAIIKSGVANVMAQTLPDDAPEDFTGAVGKFKIETSVDKSETETDDPITLKVRISGSGNIMMADEPMLLLPNDFEVYDPTIAESISEKSTVVNGSKSYDYLIIPRNPGEFKINPLSFSYFDPVEEAYKTLTSDLIDLKITGEPSSVSPIAGSVTKEDIDLVGKDIRYIKQAPATFLQSRGGICVGTVSFYSLYAAPLALFFVLLLVRKKREDFLSDKVMVNKHRASKLARKSLEEAKKHLDKNDEKNFYDHVVHGIWSYLGNKLNIDRSQLSKENIREKLGTAGVPVEKTNTLMDLIKNCEMALYAPSAVSGGMPATYESALNLLSEMERTIK